MTDLQSSDLRTSLHGLWLPLVTPFCNGELDEASLRRLVRHYGALPVDGLILAATTGESLTLTSEETERLVFTVRDEAAGARGFAGSFPICLGLSGSNTSALLETLARTAAWPIDGYLISCPYYSRPSQKGLELHFSALADRAVHPVVLYNIPYRTGVNLGNEAMLRLAGHNIVGLKDCCADRNQSLDLLRRRPQNFAVLTGEDAQYQEALTDGADGGILVVPLRHYRHSGVRAHRNRSLRRDPEAGGGGRARCRAGLLEVGRGTHPIAVRRAEPGADQVLAMAHGIDRKRGVKAADDGSKPRPCGTSRSGDPTKSSHEGPTSGGVTKIRGPCVRKPIHLPAGADLFVHIHGNEPDGYRGRENQNDPIPMRPIFCPVESKQREESLQSSLSHQGSFPGLGLNNVPDASEGR